MARLTDLLNGGQRRQLNRILFAAGEIVQVHAQISITEGAISGKDHVPSRPGEPPNNDTGVLANNIETVNKEDGVVEVSSNAPYSTRLEFGDSRVAARPFMRPARDKNAKKVKAFVTRGINQMLRRAR